MSAPFLQSYEPVGGSVVASAVVASLPLLVLALLLAVLRARPWQAALAGAATAVSLAVLVWQLPLGLALSTTSHGMAFGLWPISWVVLNAVFFYNLTVASGDFDVIRRSLARLTADRRIQALLVAFCFGALVEGIAGFGAPVAISAAMLAGLGFEPLAAAVLALVANTAPVAFGSIGIPVVTLGGLLAPLLGRDTASTTRALSAMVGRQLPVFSLLIPAYLVVLLAGWRRMIEVLPAVATAGLSFALVQFLASNLLGPELTDILSSLASLAAMAVLLKLWRPRQVWRGDGTDALTREEGRTDPPARVARAYAMYGILVGVVLLGQLAANAGLKNVRWD
jgi:lactate permease